MAALHPTWIYFDKASLWCDAAPLRDGRGRPFRRESLPAAEQLLISAQPGAGDYEAEHVLATTVFQAMSSPAASAFSNQYVIPISRYIVVAMVRCPCASPRLPAHR